MPNGLLRPSRTARPQAGRLRPYVRSVPAYCADRNLLGEGKALASSHFCVPDPLAQNSS